MVDATFLMECQGKAKSNRTKNTWYKKTEALVEICFFEKLVWGVCTKFTTKPLKGSIVKVWEERNASIFCFRIDIRQLYWSKWCTSRGCHIGHLECIRCQIFLLGEKYFETECGNYAQQYWWVQLLSRYEASVLSVQYMSNHRIPTSVPIRIAFPYFW